jgi:hypothetical protein
VWDQAALTANLNNVEVAEVVMTFDQIEKVVGALPASARKHNAWWANSARSQSHARAWLDAGFLATPQFVEGQVRFRRGAPSAPGSRSPRTVTSTTTPIPDLIPTGESYRGEVAYSWLGAGEATLVNGRLITPALGVGPGVYRFILVEPEGQVRSYYIGESDNLFQRMNGYRNPGSLQPTNKRINSILRELIEDGGTAPVSVILGATLDGEPLDLARKPARLVVENTALLHLATQGAAVENLRSGS